MRGTGSIPTALKASKAADSVIPAIHEPVKVRRPVKWGKPAAITLFVLLLGGLGVLQVMPLSNSSYERLASEALGRPVKIGAVHLSIITGVELRLDGLSVGEGVRATTVHAVPQLGTLFSDKKAFSRVSIEGLVIPQGRTRRGAARRHQGRRVVDRPASRRRRPSLRDRWRCPTSTWRSSSARTARCNRWA